MLKYHNFALNKLISHFFIKYFILLNSAAFIVQNFVFVYLNTSQFDAVLGSCIYIFGICQSAGMFLCYAFNLNKIQAVHIELQKIIDKIVEGMIN